MLVHAIQIERRTCSYKREHYSDNVCEVQANAEHSLLKGHEQHLTTTQPADGGSTPPKSRKRLVV
jgi:hypothetical protein